jgi:hypothetical protein
MSTRFYDTDLTDAAWAWVAPVLLLLLKGCAFPFLIHKIRFSSLYVLGPLHLTALHPAETKSAQRIFHDFCLKTSKRSTFFATLLTKDKQFLAQRYNVQYVANGRDLLRELKRSTAKEGGGTRQCRHSIRGFSEGHDGGRLVKRAKIVPSGATCR